MAKSKEHGAKAQGNQTGSTGLTGFLFFMFQETMSLKIL
jgi:hypothetical protein